MLNLLCNESMHTAVNYQAADQRDRQLGMPGSLLTTMTNMDGAEAAFLALSKVSALPNLGAIQAGRSRQVAPGRSLKMPEGTRIVVYEARRNTAETLLDKDWDSRHHGMT